MLAPPNDSVSAQVTVRVMNYYQFMNSKVLFKEVRHKPAGTTTMPVMVHISKWQQGWLYSCLWASCASRCQSLQSAEG